MTSTFNRWHPYKGVTVVPATADEITDALLEHYSPVIPREVAVRMTRSVLDRFVVLKPEKSK